LLRNVGQFDSVDAAADIPLAPLTLVYSENGRGKTTLAAILRSLASGDPLPIAERRRLGAQHPPHVVLECGDPPPAIFQDNAWNRVVTDLAVFDDVFIDQNVHSGLTVDAHHRQNLHEVILGGQAVALNRQLRELVERIEGHNQELRASEHAIPVGIRGPFSVEEFCALPARPDIDHAIEEAERALASAREQDGIRATSPFDSLDLPEFDPTPIERALEQDLASLDRTTLQQVQEHLARLGHGAEAWVAEGVGRIPAPESGEASGRCPFCAQDLEGSPVIGHYRAYFSDAYAALKRSVAGMLDTVNRTHGGDVPAGFERAVRVAVERRQFWSRFCEVSEFTVDTAAVVRDWRAAREALAAQLEAKRAAPLEPIHLSRETRGLVAAYERHRQAVAATNQLLQQANRAIGVAKERAATANPVVLAADLDRLKAVRERHTPQTAALCDDYRREKAAKATTEQRRDQTRAQLEQHRATVFPGYQTALNLYLHRFNAGFRLDRMTYANTRGGPTCTYDVVINNSPVTVGGSDPTPGEPSFRNILSSGDRNTLALALFFASLEQEPNLAGKVVVIDDPISSLDEHRTLTTAQEIRRLAERTSQVIVLSHDRTFLCRIWEGADAGRAALEVVRDGLGSTLRSWDVAQDSLTEHDRRHAALREYLTSGVGEKREVARSIRPHLESFLRVAYPEHYAPGMMLGQFIDLCQRKVGTADEAMDSASIQELRDLNEYARRYHHQAWETEPINDGELRGFVQRALRFSRR